MPFRVTILGSSSALPTANRFPSAHLLTIDERFFLIDCGEGTQIQLRRLNTKMGRINHIFISHLHGDHVFGLPGLISTFTLLNRTSDLHIFAFAELQEMLERQFLYLRKEMSFRIIYHPLSNDAPHVIHEDTKLTVTSIPLKHSIPCCGFLFAEKERLRNIIKTKIEEYNIPRKEILNIKKGADFITDDGRTIPNTELTVQTHIPLRYGFCSDTGFNPSIVPLIRNAHLLYHEATFLNKDAKTAKQTLHSTAEQAAKIAQMASVKQLVIGHFSSRYKSDLQFLEEAKAVFPATILAQDGLTISITS